MMRRAVLLALLALPLLGEVPKVLVTEHGKTYHHLATCMSLSRAPKVYQVAEADAIKNGLRKCGICWRESKKKADTGWMKGER